jgi:hypothetical protein
MDTEHHDQPATGLAALYPKPGDQRTAAKTPKRVLALQFVLGGIGGAVLAVSVHTLVGELSLTALAGLFALSLLMLWVQVLVHEAGHAVAGLLTGRRLIGAGVGPLRLERGTGGWHLRWGGGVRGIGGFAALLPADDRVESRRDAAAFLLGGPLANLVTAAIALLALWLAPPLGVIPSVLLGATVFGGAMLGIVNLLPFQSHGWHSDGYHLRELRHDTPASRVMRTQQCVYALAMAGVRPRDWPLQHLEVADGLPPDTVLVAQLLRMSWALDRDDRAAAEAAAGALAGQYPTLADGKRQGVAVMLATYAARVAHDAKLLAAWRPLCEGGLLDLGPYRLWLDAEAAAMAGDAEAARERSARARAAIPRIHDLASAIVMGEYLDRLDQHLATARTAAVETR